ASQMAVKVTATDPDGLSAAQRVSVTVTDGATSLTTSNNEDLYPRWSPDGAEIAFTSYEELFSSRSFLRVAKADGGGVRSLATPGFRDPAWSPDGTKIAATLNDTIYVLNAADFTGGTRLVAGRSPQWSPDGTQIAGSRPGSIFFFNVDLSTGGASFTSGGATTGSPQWSPDGTKIAVTFNDIIWVLNVGGSGGTRLVSGRSPQWSPDGTQIAFERISTSEGRVTSANVFVMDADGSGVTQLTPASDLDRLGGWSPDGARIVFTSLRYGDNGSANERGIFVMNADGSGVTRLTTDSPRGLEWSPVGTKIAFSADRDDDDDYQIYIMEVPATGSSADLPGDAPERPAFEVTPPRR
ncbi:MAG: hypothetical protein OXN85_03925, partial [Gemmatimonadetes bacterium]|nr:hypothetical protein [Candidatus Palauibacter australiensis]